MNSTTILSCLSGLEANNNRDWYHAHKVEYQEANGQFETLIQDLIFKIGETDGSILHNAPKDLTFKLVRDTRFSHDKSPYNPAFRAHIAARGKLPVPVGCYLMIKPGDPLALVIGGHTVDWTIFSLLAAPLIFLPTYTGVKINRWFFYIFYPAHLALIVLVKYLISIA